MSRRALLFAGGVLPVAGAAAALPVLLRDDEDEDDHPETIRVGPGVTPSSPRAALPAASGGTSATRTLEFYFFGTTTLKSLTTTVNGQSVTVRNRRLPYRRTVQIPRERTTWRIAYRFAAGTLVSKVIVDGAELSGMQGFSAGGKDLTDSHKGTV
jgi:hypothetical protein